MNYRYDLPKRAVKGEMNNPSVRFALELIQSGHRINQDKKEEVDAIEEMLAKAMEVSKPSGSQFVNSRIGYNTSKKVKERLDFLSYDIDFFGGLSVKQKSKNPAEAKLYSENRELHQAICKAGIESILKTSKFASSMKNSGDSAMSRAVDIGDGLMLFNMGVFEVVSFKNVYFPARATSIRNSASGMNVRQLCIVYNYSYDQFRDKFDNLKGIDNKVVKKVAWGTLPTTLNEDSTDGELSDVQSAEVQLLREGQVGIFIDLDKKELIMFAGSRATVIMKLEGKKFPFMKDGEAYMPLIQIVALNNPKSIYNYSVCHYAYQLNNVGEILSNNLIQGNINETRGLKTITVGNGKVAETQGLIYQGQLARQLGRGEPIIPIELDETGNTAIGRVGNLSSGQGTQVGEVIKNIISNDIVDFGIALREVDMGASKKVGVAQIEQENTNSLARRIMDNNIEEYRFALELVVEYIKTQLKNDKTLVNTNNIRVSDDKREVIERVTLADVSDMLNTYAYEVRIDRNSGIRPNPAAERLRLTEDMQIAQGMPQNMQLVKEYLEKGGHYFSDDAYVPTEVATEQTQESIQGQSETASIR